MPLHRCAIASLWGFLIGFTAFSAAPQARADDIQFL